MTFFEALAEVREVLECLGIVLDENSLTVVDHIASSSVVLVKKEQGSEDLLWEEDLEPADEELASDVPLIIDMGESPPTGDEDEPTAVPQTIDIGESPMFTISINGAGEIKREDEHDANDILKKGEEEGLSDMVAEVPLLKVNIISADKTKNKKCGRKAKKLEGEEKGLVTKLKRKYKKEVKDGEPEGEGGVLRRKNRCELCTYSTNNKV